ncbi:MULTISPECIES: gamma-glutamylcyclotransferase family protein [Protofrankia]|uniref:Putative gamma-glutamylcyclotransferase n=1 Tax=Protofrankia coriariae TaxID=1562887 RepID=A0ABR5F7B7_9ACTN|nr:MULTISPECIES: gamma-glutamylcyclotransferase family protein [Protofrankia]KLL12624.1 gamma-glutamyl cyclotransferase [Protofrankia coriariae]ONH36229.1 gamma-glutamylcyclotransferase [Protofrankia sp. BMG5.30]
MSSLFVYGTLCFPEVALALLGRLPRSRPAAVAGWRAAALPGRVYPGLVPAAVPTALVAGRVLSGLSPRERAVLDAFEGDEYEARRVVLVDGRSASVYVWRDVTAALDQTWDADAFAAAQLPAFVSRISRRPRS